ncbi:MAG: TonB-dependent receptor [Pseudomonadota bacterium]
MVARSYIAFWSVFVLALGGASLPGATASEPTPGIEQIIVRGLAVAPNPVQSSRYVIPQESLGRAHPRSLADALALAPGAAVQTNSRGERLVYLRGAGERQVALFLDGAPINVPWDNRLDLNHIPAAVVDRLFVSAGPTSVRYGPNTLGGAIEIIPAAPERQGRVTSVRIGGGDEGAVDIDAKTLARAGDFYLTLAGEHSRASAAPVSGRAALAFQPDGETGRLNTDRRRTSVFARVAHEFGSGAVITASALAVDADFGVAPEGGSDVTTEDTRFWRYPTLKHRLGVINAQVPFGASNDIELSAWVQQFNQEIDSFDGPAFSILETTSDERTLSSGARLIVERNWGANKLVGNASFVASRHRERDIAGPGTGAPNAHEPFTMFRQHQYSIGAEYSRFIGNNLELMLGASGDIADHRENGEYGARTFRAYNVIGGFRWRVGGGVTVRASSGRKTRLPTQRELFGEAIGRFIVNPDLKPENAKVAELGFLWTGARARIEITPFASLVSNTIDQERIVIDGRQLRRRINLRGSRVYGVEMAGEVRLSEGLSLRQHLAANRLRRLVDASGEPDRLTERPKLLMRSEVIYEHPSGVSGRMEILHRGRAFALDEANALTPLRKSTAFNLVLSYAFERSNARLKSGEIYLRADNVTDALIEPQLGLPAPGRQVRAGIGFSF